MNPFGVNKVNSSEIDTLKSQVSAGKQSNIENVEKKQALGKNGVTKPNIELDDFFTSDNYLEILSNLSLEELKKLGVNDDENWLREGTKPLAENFSLYYFDNDGLHLTFPPYQVAPWESGPIKIVIPSSKLINLIKPVDN